MTEIVWLPLGLLERVHHRQIVEHGGLPGVRDQGLFESAVLRPENAHHYGEDDLCTLAALYAAGIVKNHPFLDGNKRTGWIACELFLMANDVRVTANNAEGLAATMMLAAGELNEAQFADWLREMTEPI